MGKRRELKVGDLVRITQASGSPVIRGVYHGYNVGDIASVVEVENKYGDPQLLVGTVTQGIPRSGMAYDRKANADKAKYEARRG